MTEVWTDADAARETAGVRARACVPTYLRACVRACIFYQLAFFIQYVAVWPKKSFRKESELNAEVKRRLPGALTGRCV